MKNILYILLLFSCAAWGQKADSLYHLTINYFELKDYPKAIQYSKKYLHVFSPRNPLTKGCITREAHYRRMFKKIICLKLADYYREESNPRTAVRYLIKIDRK